MKSGKTRLRSGNPTGTTEPEALAPQGLLGSVGGLVRLVRFKQVSSKYKDQRPSGGSLLGVRVPPSPGAT